MSNIYTEIILDHYQNPRNFGKIKKPTYSVKVNNPLCGDSLELYIKIDNKIITDVKFIANGCAISVASVSLISQYLKGKSENELKKINQEFIIKMLGIELGLNRIKCALLPLKAIKKIKNE